MAWTESRALRLQDFERARDSGRITLLAQNGDIEFVKVPTPAPSTYTTSRQEPPRACPRVGDFDPNEMMTSTLVRWTMTRLVDSGGRVVYVEQR